MSETNEAQPQTWFRKNLIWILLLAGLVVGNLATYFVQKARGNAIRVEMTHQMEDLASSSDALMRHQNAEHIKAAGKALTYVARAEMQRGNKEQLDLFLVDMVQQTEIEMVSIIDSAGKVFLSTNKKYQGKYVSEVLPSIPPVVNRPQVLENTTRKATFASPVMANDRRIGFLIMEIAANNRTQKLLDAIHEGIPKLDAP